jgi:NAD(P)-dependent dehydrogenase (short-subunit alcohol dehydrogenase family)
VIGGSAGIGLETARRARAEGADVIITARDPDRLHRVGLELGARIAAFDATDFDRLGRFFDELPTPIDHVLVTGPGPYYAPLAEFEVEKARRDFDAHFLLPLQVARNAAGKVRPGGTVLFMGGTGGRRTALGLSFISALTAALPAMTKNLALELAPIRVEPDRSRIRRHAAVGGDPRRPAGRAPRAAPHDAADPTRRRPGRHRRTGRAPHGEHGGHRRDLRHRRRPAARRGVSR